RNRLNHLFGLAQLIRLSSPSSALLPHLDGATGCLETCVAALAEPTPKEEAPIPTTPHLIPSLAGGAATLLIADDDAENRDLLRRLLDPHGFQLHFAENGKEAVALLARQDFDAVLLDIQMPEMDGFEVLSHLRETGLLRNTPVIVVTGLQEEHDAVRCIENGAEDFLSRPIRPALLMARLSASLEKKRLREKVFEQHFTRELARELARSPDPMKMQARQADVTVMFCDIRGFSAVSERLGPTQTVAWLSGVMGDFSSIVIDHGGVLVDYTGDELLAMWGAPNEQPDHAELACRAGIEILRHLPALSEHWMPLVGAETQVGIGINSGEALVGNVGTHRKFKYGPLGTAVNLASRVQGATKFLRTSMLLTGETASRIARTFPTRRLCRVRVQNIATPVDLHELGAPGDGPGGHQLNHRYEQALDAFEKGDFSLAENLLESFLEAAPGDGPARMLYHRIVAEQTGLSVAFDPVWSLPGK
ncbi:MAG TPA: response regulator, partial [Bacteroidia bacterium]|nr:response regulator [Bacteroidia bacterium]